MTSRVKAILKAMNNMFYWTKLRGGQNFFNNIGRFFQQEIVLWGWPPGPSLIDGKSTTEVQFTVKFQPHKMSASKSWNLSNLEKALLKIPFIIANRMFYITHNHIYIKSINIKKKCLFQSTFLNTITKYILIHIFIRKTKLLIFDILYQVWTIDCNMFGFY